MADVERLISLLARDAFRAMQPFVPNAARPDGRTTLLDYEPNEVASAVSHHASFREAVEAVAADDDLGKIAPMGDLGPVLLAATGGPRVSANELVGDCVVAAAVEMRCRGLEPRADSLVEMSLQNVERLRGIARRTPVYVSTFFGLSGVSAPENRALELPWGKLAAPVGWYGFARVFERRPTSCVLIAEHVLDIAIEAPQPPQHQAIEGELTMVFVDPKDVPPPIRNYHEWSVRTLQLIGLCVVLGTPNRRVAPVPTFQLTVVPYESQFGGRGHLVLAPPAVERTLTEEECREIERFAPILKAHYSPRLEVVGRRIIAAVTQRLDPADRLIDAVTAWESLFSAHVDASFRVTAAIALLLEPTDAMRRGELQRELVKIYYLRSDVVHGRSTDDMVVFSQSYAATEMAIQAFGALLERRPDLIEHDPAERSRRLLLGLS